MANAGVSQSTAPNGSKVPGIDLGRGVMSCSWTIDTNSTTGLDWVYVGGFRRLTWYITNPSGATATIDFFASMDGTNQAGSLTGGNPIANTEFATRSPMVSDSPALFVRPEPTASVSGGTVTVTLLAS